MASTEVFIINKVSNAKKIARFFTFLYESYFILCHFYFECNQNNP